MHLYKNKLKITLTIFISALAIGCSNSTSPVSVSQENNVSRVASLFDQTAIDLSITSLSSSWALSYQRVPGLNDFYIYKYIESGDYWVNTGHYGKCIASGFTEKCFHVNSRNDIWWGSTTGNGFIPNGSNITNFDDIAATERNGITYLYFIGQSNGYQVMWKCTISSNQNATWQQIFYPNNGIPSWDPSCISCDPYNGNKVIVVFGGGPNGVGQVYTSTNGCNSWTYQNVGVPCTNASWCANNIVVRARSGEIWKKKSTDASYTRAVSGYNDPVISASCYNAYFYTQNAILKCRNF